MDEPDHAEFEPVASGLWRCEVPSGWLYTTHPIGGHLAFVPFPPGHTFPPDTNE